MTLQYSIDTQSEYAKSDSSNSSKNKQYMRIHMYNNSDVQSLKHIDYILIEKNVLSLNIFYLPRLKRKTCNTHVCVFLLPMIVDTQQRVSAISATPTFANENVAERSIDKILHSYRAIDDFKSAKHTHTQSLTTFQRRQRQLSSFILFDIGARY